MVQYPTTPCHCSPTDHIPSWGSLTPVRPHTAVQCTRGPHSAWWYKTPPPHVTAPLQTTYHHEGVWLQYDPIQLYNVLVVHIVHDDTIPHHPMSLLPYRPHTIMRESDSSTTPYSCTMYSWSTECMMAISFRNSGIAVCSLSFVRHLMATWIWQKDNKKWVNTKSTNKYQTTFL